MDSQCPGGDWPEHWTPQAEYDQTSKVYTRYCQNLTSVPSDIPSDAKKVYIRGNRKLTLKARDFEKLSKCTFLDLQWNEIKWIGKGTFFGLSSLTELFLSHNNLTTLDSGSFHGLVSLKSLFLDQNHLRTLHKGSLAGEVCQGRRCL